MLRHPAWRLLHELSVAVDWPMCYRQQLHMLFGLPLVDLTLWAPTADLHSLRLRNRRHACLLSSPGQPALIGQATDMVEHGLHACPVQYGH